MRIFTHPPAFLLVQRQKLKGRVTLPKQMNFHKKIQIDLPPPLIFGESCCNFSEKSFKKPCLKLQNLQHNFWIENPSPTLPLELFRKFIRFVIVTASKYGLNWNYLNDDGFVAPFPDPIFVLALVLACLCRGVRGQRVQHLLHPGFPFIVKTPFFSL